MKKTGTKYFIPPEHIQSLIIANTPLWLREHFRKEAMRETFEKLCRVHNSGECECWHTKAKCDYGIIIKELSEWLDDGERK